jgi:hypothetical protein
MSGAVRPETVGTSVGCEGIDRTKITTEDGGAALKAVSIAGCRTHRLSRFEIMSD